jgi:NAD(P)H-binding
MSTPDDEQAHSSVSRIGGLGPKTGLVTGATGYVGGRLLHRFEASGRHRVRCLTRRPEALAGRTDKDTEVVAGDVLDSAALRRAMEGVEAAYYRIHSMETSGEFEALDRAAARPETLDAHRRLRLAAEMKIPGRPWLRFEIDPHDDGGGQIRQTRVFDPAGHRAGLLVPLLSRPPAGLRQPCSAASAAPSAADRTSAGRMADLTAGSDADRTELL